MFCVIFLSCVLSLVLGEYDPFSELSNRHGTECAREKITPSTSFGNTQITDEMRKCADVNHKLLSCIASEKGYLLADGTIDKNVLAGLVEKDFENDPKLAENIKKICIFADASQFYVNFHDNMLDDLTKIELCVDSQVLSNVNDWDDEGKCKGIKTIVEECAELSPK